MPTLSKKIQVAILFGGPSVEHDVSIHSARSVVAAIDRKKFDITLIGIDHAGQWRLRTLAQLKKGGKIATGVGTNLAAEAVTPLGSNGKLHLPHNRVIDVVFPVLHGTGGEDGTMQGLLRLAGVPFVGPDVLGSAVAMDKVVAKHLLQLAGLPIAKFKSFKAHQRGDISADTLAAALGWPMFIKPANCGSSVGVSKAHNSRELAVAIDTAFRYDNKILIEEYVQGQEVECAVLGNEHLRASEPGSLVPTEEFYSYDAKYIKAEGAHFAIPADISPAARRKVQAMALAACTALECEGMARVDFFVTRQENLVLNEVNTIPGFTAISMYPKLWKYSGLSYNDLITTLIHLAIARFERQQRLQFESA